MVTISYSSEEELQKLLNTPINRLGLDLKNSPLEAHIQRLYSELRYKNITYLPVCYLSDEWGCPHGVPLIGIPFYLADPVLSSFEAKYSPTPAESPQEVMMYLRHEAGHALNYAFQLYLQPRWEEIFGSFTRPYKERYQFVPDHKGFVNHLPDAYAQKHPDEDFAETFAVWLTPESNWRNIYLNTPAFSKLEYLDTLMKYTQTTLPTITSGEADEPIDDIDMTLKEWYDTQRSG